MKKLTLKSVNSAMTTLERFIYDTKENIKMDACVGETLICYMDFLHNRLYEEPNINPSIRLTKDKIYNMIDTTWYKFLYVDSTPSNPDILKKKIMDAFDEYCKDMSVGITSFVSKDYAKKAFDACVMLMAQGYNYKVYQNINDHNIKEYIIFKKNEEPLIRVMDNGTGIGGFFDYIENYGDLYNTWRVFAKWYKEACTLQFYVNSDN